MISFSFRACQYPGIQTVFTLWKSIWAFIFQVKEKHIRASSFFSCAPMRGAGEKGRTLTTGGGA
ncbi:MAG TPA: hypothetical protein DDX86_05450 [Akkermansia sp.]|nr:hypothetical protein [Akkermansia sp.]